ncbi:serine acetyltransferase [Algivirga pacifica]|uniref:Serine O-acetyltransferase n=1 Tax=Algivirga pacifica TaxID=1162670 RepID=A0ABP9DJY3_9BACT
MKDFKKIYARIQENKCCMHTPPKEKAEDFIDSLYNFLFPVVSGHEQGAMAAELSFYKLKGKFQELLLPLRDEFEVNIEEICNTFFKALPDAYTMIMDDARALLAGDPAAKHIEEVILAYPGFFATYVYRMAHIIYQLKIPIIPRLFSEYAHRKTGIDIHPGAKIGHSFCMDHGTGIVIGETCEIGDHVKIYQGVTLGALSVEKSMAEIKRHPTIEDNVVIYAGSTILGGHTIIGKNSVVGGNVWLTSSLAPNSVVYHRSEVKIRNNEEVKENAAIDFEI